MSLTALKKQSFKLSQHDSALVSVIIRSMDRPSLTEALDSVAMQSYGNIEVVLVDAKGDGHREMGERCGRFPLRFVKSSERLQRGSAANKGLDAAQGEYLIFLDDDDWFDSDHIEKLVCAIECEPEIKVAYSGVRCVDDDGNKLPVEFATPFNAIQLLAGNYIPIHAALFSKSLLELGCRVDESLDYYEDWDFWIQASLLTDFLFTGELSAIYRIGRQSGFGVNADPSLVEENSLRVFRKWLSRLPDDKIFKLMEAVRLNRIIDQRIIDLNRAVSERDSKINTLEAERVALLASTSWRITKPLRFLAHQLKRIKHNLSSG